MDALMPQLNAAGDAWRPHAASQLDSSRGQAAFRSGPVNNAVATATIPGVPGETSYITGFDIYSGGATAAALVDVTIAGLAGGSITFPFSVPAGVALAAVPLQVRFPFPLKASAANTPITVSVAALGSGSTKTQAIAYGGQRP